MSSEQVRRDNTPHEREIPIEKDTVPKITSHFGSLTVIAKDSETPQESGKERSHDSGARSGNTTGEVGARGKARESHELGSHKIESLNRDVNREKGREHEKDRDKESCADQARRANMASEKQAEAKRSGRGEHEKTIGLHAVGKFDMSSEERGGQMQGQAGGRQEKEMGRQMQGQARGRQEREMERQMQSQVKGHRQEREKSTQMQGHEEGHRQEKERGRQKQGQAGGQGQEKEMGRQMQGQAESREKQPPPSLERITKARGTAQQNSAEALRAAEERYNQAKEEVRHKLGSATEYAAEKGSQAKDLCFRALRKRHSSLQRKAARPRTQLYRRVNKVMSLPKRPSTMQAKLPRDTPFRKQNKPKIMQ